MYMYIHKMYDNNANKEDHNGSIYVLYVHVYNMYKYIIHVYTVFPRLVPARRLVPALE